MKSIHTWLTCLLLAVAAQAALPAETDDIAAAKKFLEEYPEKELTISSDDRLMQLIAKHGITVSPRFQVLAVDATHGLPQVFWVFRDRALTVKCELIEHREENVKADMAALFDSFKAADDSWRAFLPGVAKNLVGHLKCTSESDFLPSPQMTLSDDNDKVYVTYRSLTYAGEAMFLAHYDGIQVDILAMGNKELETKPAR